MTFFTLTLRSARFYWRAHALVLTGTLLATAILTGAMLVGDSVKFSLMRSALLRLGNIGWALDTRGRFFPADLATRLGAETDVCVAPALLFRGLALNAAPGTEPRQINSIQILGVERSFWALADKEAPAPALTSDGMAINEKLASELRVKPGDQVSIRFSKPALMSRDAPLSTPEKHDTVRATFTVRAIVSDHHLGRFNLKANQQIPCTAFVSLPLLQQVAGLERKANLLLASAPPPADGDAESAGPGPANLNAAIRKVWRLEDAGLRLRTIDGGRLYQLECDRVFMDPAIGRALAELNKPVGTLTYLVNSIARTGDRPARETPYSFVAALSPTQNDALGLVTPEMQDDEIILSRWLAAQLDARPGDPVTLTYYEFGAVNKFVETHRTFTVRRIAEMNEVAGERELGPAFPGLTDAGRCAEWSIGMPLEKSKVEDAANEAYWNEYRATPKAFVTLKAGREMWANRFGDLTGVRFPATPAGAEAVTDVLLRQLDPATLGLAFMPVRTQAIKAAAEAMDLGELFIGMSFFLIAASLMLTGLLFAFGIQQRSGETGLLQALGFRTGQIRRLWIQECLLIALAGAVAGAFLGVLYTRSMIWGLGHFWQQAIAHAGIEYHATTGSLVTGALTGLVFAVASLLITIRHQTAKTARTLFSGAETDLFHALPGGTMRHRRPNWLKGGVMAGGLLALGLIVHASLAEQENPAPLFFAAGSLLLISLLGLTRLLLIRLAQPGRRLTPLSLGVRNAGRNLSRSQTVAGLLACGCFLILAVSSMQEDIDREASRRDAGTGGFALFAEATLPLDEKLSLASYPELRDVQVVAMKVRDGDDASCLNLNRAQSPTLIGVNPGEFMQRRAFQSVQANPGPWALLNRVCPDGAIPALVGDANTAQWGLKSKTGIEEGDILMLRDERGEPFRVKLVGTLPMRLSVFQGAILISSEAFASRYPSESGARMFLFDAPPGTARAARAALNLRLDKWGINVIPAAERLESFYTVEQTYMAMFLVLGGLGLLLGSTGMAIVMLRNIRERRNELALLSATGYTMRQIHTVVLAEHGVILGLGLTAGVSASLAAIWPGLQTPGVSLPWGLMLLIILGMIVLQSVLALLAGWWALKAPLLDALRNQ